MKRIFPIVVLIVTILAISVALLPNKNNSLTVTPEPSDKPEVTEQPSNEGLGLVMVPEGMKLYSDSQLGFRIAYPDDFTYQKNGDYSLLLSPPENPVGNPVPTFFYISVVPAEEQKSNGGEIYNYRWKDYEALENLSVNSSITLTENRELDQWYRYTRLGDREIAGMSAKQFVNMKPWEFPNGTQETRYVLNKNGTQYILGAYYQTNNPRLTKQIISDMTDSFSILSGQEILE